MASKRSSLKLLACKCGLETLAKRGRPEDFRDILAQFPDTPPLLGDKRCLSGRFSDEASLFDILRQCFRIWHGPFNSSYLPHFCKERTGHFVRGDIV